MTYRAVKFKALLLYIKREKMIKFFRKIRRRLIAKGKLNSYLIYALGEIFLVVCGILIALQINTWNEGRKNEKLERKIITEMKKNLQVDLSDVKWNIDRNQMFLQSNQNVLQHLQTRSPFVDSLETDFGNIMGNTQLVKNSSAYDNLKSLGFNLISNDSLRMSITNLYGARYNYISNFEKIDDRFQWDNLYPAFRSNVELFKIWEKASPFAPAELVDNNNFKESLKMNIELRQFAIGVYESLERDILTTISLIDEELQD